MKHVINFSGGLCSFWAAHRVIQKHGPGDVTLLFADTLEEDPELHEFNAQASILLGVPITRVSTEESIWDLFEREHMIGNNRFPICSVRLKREPLNNWHKHNCVELNTVIYLGFDWTEEKRLEDMRREHPDWMIEAPMTKQPIWDKCRMEKEAASLGLKIPEMYKLGFPHFNCGGRCVRAGISHWVHLLNVRPASFKDWEDKEWNCASNLRAIGVEPMSILKDRRGGESKSLYLRDLRLRVEAGEKFTRFDWGGCGCGGATQAA